MKNQLDQNVYTLYIYTYSDKKSDFFQLIESLILRVLIRLSVIILVHIPLGLDFPMFYSNGIV